MIFRSNTVLIEHRLNQIDPIEQSSTWIYNFLREKRGSLILTSTFRMRSIITHKFAIFCTRTIAFGHKLNQTDPIEQRSIHLYNFLREARFTHINKRV